MMSATVITMNKNPKKINSKIKNLIYRIVYFLILIVFIGCTSNLKKSDLNNDHSKYLKNEDSDFIYMTMNVENLFDTLHDEGKNDYTFLPLEKKQNKEIKDECKKEKISFRSDECLNLNWNSQLLNFKLNQISQVIKSIDNGKGPDILSLVEVENLSVLNQLVENNLKELGYKTAILIEGDDPRGIDNALISKWPLSRPAINHRIPYKNIEKPDEPFLSRGLLEVELRTPASTTVTVLVAHLPSQAASTIYRGQAIEYIKNKISELAKAKKAVILAGDFNITDEEEAEQKYWSQKISEVAFVSHLMGCKECEGTHNYKGKWSFLDAISVSKNFELSGYKPQFDTVQVVKTSNNSKPNGSPLRFDPENKKGVSDHFPLLIKFKKLK